MSRLAQIVSSRRSQGGSVTGSLAGGIKERLKEKFDPRQLINQKGLLVSLFPGLKPFKAKTERASRESGKSIEKSSLDFSNVKPIFENIQYNTTITAKNLSVLPSIHRDFNVIRQNIVKLLKLESIDAATKADMFFKAEAKREEMYESQLSKIKTESKTPSKIEKSKTGSIFDLLIFGGLLALLVVSIKKVVEVVDNIRNIDMKSAMQDFGNYLTNSFEKIFDSLKNIADIPAMSIGDLNLKDIFARIRKGESGGKLKPEDYNVAFLTKGQKTPEQFSGKKLTDMTLQEVLDFQKNRESVQSGQSAVGAYQFMPTTLFGKEGFYGKGKIGGIVAKSGFSMDTKFSKETQDRLAEILMQENVKALESMKFPITPQNLAMAWSIGPGGVAAVYKAIKEGRGEESVASALKHERLPVNEKNNPHLVKNKAKDFYGYFTKKMGYSEMELPPGVTLPKNVQTQPDTSKTIKEEPKKQTSPVSFNTNANRDLNLAGVSSRSRASSLQDRYLDVSTQNVLQETPIVFINTNNKQNLVVLGKESKSKDYLPFLFETVVI